VGANLLIVWKTRLSSGPQQKITGAQNLRNHYFVGNELWDYRKIKMPESFRNITNGNIPACGAVNPLAKSLM
jgi:hypothetical protein